MSAVDDLPGTVETGRIDDRLLTDMASRFYDDHYVVNDPWPVQIGVPQLKEFARLALAAAQVDADHAAAVERNKILDFLTQQADELDGVARTVAPEKSRKRISEQVWTLRAAARYIGEGHHWTVTR